MKIQWYKTLGETRVSWLAGVANENEKLGLEWTGGAELWWARQDLGRVSQLTETVLKTHSLV